MATILNIQLNSGAKMAKDTYIRVRLETAEKELIVEAAKIKTDGNTSKYIVGASIAKAKRDLAKGK